MYRSGFELACYKHFRKFTENDNKYQRESFILFSLKRGFRFERCLLCWHFIERYNDVAAHPSHNYLIILVYLISRYKSLQRSLFTENKKFILQYISSSLSVAEMYNNNNNKSSLSVYRLFSVPVRMIVIVWMSITLLFDHYKVHKRSVMLELYALVIDKDMNHMIISVHKDSTAGLWDSLKKAAFVIGSGLFFLVGFRNSVTW